MKRPFAFVGFSELFSLIFLLITDSSGTEILVPVLLLVSLTAVFLHKMQAAKYLTVFTAVFTLSALLLAYADIQYRFPGEVLSGQSAYVSGKVTEIKSDGRYVLQECYINGEPTKIGIFLITDTQLKVQIDDILWGQCEFSESNTPAEDAFFFHTLSNRIALTAFTGYHTPVVTAAKSHSLLYYIAGVRDWLKNRLQQNLTEETAPLAFALLLGDTSLLEPSFQAALRIGGASHIFAVSGMHLSIWSSLFFLVLRKRSRTKWLPNILFTLFLLFYIALTGFSPSVMRAGVMLFIASWGYVLRAKSDSLNSIGIACTLLLTVNPYMAGNVSFLLSTLATASLFTVYPLAEQRLSRPKSQSNVKKKLLGLRNALFLSLGVLLFTVPVSGFFFGTVSLWSPVSSVLCTLPAQGIMLFSFLGNLLTGVPYVGHCLFQIAELCCTLLNTVVNLIAENTFAVCPVDIKQVGVWYIVTAFAVLIVYLFTKHNRKSIFITLAISATTVCILGGVQSVLQRDVTELTVLNGGDNTNILLTSNAGGSVSLIGTGSHDKLYTFNQLCQRKTVYDIDVLILPRIHDTENAGTASFIADFTVKRILSAPENIQLPTDNQNISLADDFTVSLWQDYVYRNLNDNNKSVGMLTLGDTKIILCYYPATDFASLDDTWQCGDILICRSALPKNIHPENYKAIIVSTEKTAFLNPLPKHAITTAERGSITIKIEKGGVGYDFTG